MQDALLAGADLRWARLDGARLTGTVYDKSTRWPKGFDPEKHGSTLAQWDASVWRAFGRPGSPGAN
jgi:Pentapeptide repeats (8 copies)